MIAYIAFHNTLIEVPAWGSATLVEILWLASGLMALLFSSLRIRPLWLDYQVTKRLKQEDLCIIAFGYLRREILRIVTAIDIALIGLWYVANSSPIPGPAKLTIGGLLITVGLFIISLIVSVNSVLDWRDRNNTIEIVRKRRHL